jgi:gliding motility-associated-like protein
MKKLLFFLYLSLAGGYVFSQCPEPVTIVASPTNPVCKNTPVTFTATSAGGISSYIWVVNGDTVGTGTSMTSSTNFAQINVYAVTNNCPTDTVTATKLIINTTLVADYNVIATECNQPLADIEILGITGTPVVNDPYTYNLVGAGGDLGQQDLYPDVPIGSYPLVITDANGCQDTTWIVMTTLECPPPNPTEVITPNEDGINDMWRINNIEFYPDNEVYIFDRWGQRVYHKNEYDNLDGWKAKYVGANMPVSTYYYVLKIKFEKQDDLVFKGPISVFR